MENCFLGLIEDSLKAHWELPALTDAESLAVARTGDKALVVLAAARLGTTRLIDNLEVSLA